MRCPNAQFAAPAEQLCSTLRHRNETLAAAESCTGGWLGREITAVPGASDVFWGSVVAYSDDAKTELAGVPSELISRHGAVSAEVSEALATGVRRRSGSDWAVSITGVAGPTGGSPDKPVGTVWIGTAGPAGTVTRLVVATGDRDEVRAAAVGAALESVLEAVEGIAAGNDSESG